MSNNQTVLITGANRGIGRGLLAKYLARSNVTAIAAVRDPSSSTSTSLSTLPVGPGSTLIIKKLDSSSPTDAGTVISSLAGTITSLDLVIANAGMAEFYGTFLQTPIQGFKDHLTTNTVASLVLFQATWPLLQKAKEPKFVTVSSTVGSVGDMESWMMSAGAYGASKAALNYFTKNIHLDNPSLIAFPIHPGWVQTDMGNAGAKANGLEEAPTSVEECVSGMIDKIDNATREKTSGKFMSYDGQHINW